MENATLHEKLLEEGWNLSPAGLDLVTENGKISDLKTVVKKLLDIDLRTVSKGTLPEDFSKTKYESIPGGIVLQVQKVKNLSSPKFQESFSNNNPNIIKVVLTDGVQNVQGIPMESIPSLHLNTSPGSKIVLTGDVEIAHCFLLLTQENATFIGGKVDHLIEKWELNRKLAKHKRDNQEEGGPPPWIPFGQKITKQIVTDKNFKSLDQGKSKEATENSEFEAQRKGAILEASKIGAPKVFGGGNNKLLDHNVQVIVDAGFTVEQAEYALKLAKNNTDRALRSLQNKSKGKDENSKGKGEERGERGKGKGRGRHRDDDSSSLKPSAKVSLFDFLEDKLPLTEKETAAPPPIDMRNNNFDRRNPRPGKPGNDRGDRQKSFDDHRGRKDGPGSFSSRIDGAERKTHMDRKLETIRFDGKKVHSEHNQRGDKSFGSFKVKNDFVGKADANKNSHRWNEKRETKPGQQNKPHIKPEKKEEEETRSNKSNFIPTNEKPPRFQKIANQHNEIPMWSEASSTSYPRLPPQQEYHLQNSLAVNLTLQQTVSNYNHSSQDHISVVPPNLNKNMFVGLPGSVSNEVPRAPPPTVPPPQSVAPPYQPRRSPAAPAYMQHDIKAAQFPGMPNVPDYPFKTNGTMMQGFNEFQAMFGNTVRSSNNAYNSQPMTFTNSSANYTNAPGNYTAAHPAGPPPNYNNPISNAPFNASGNYNSTPAPSNNFTNYTTPTYMPAQPLMQPPQAAPQQPSNVAQPPRRWSWKKGHKCFARYWEDQNYYEALVTGVSENTCVVHFTDYGNYEEVLHDDCFPIDGVPPET